MVMDDDNRRRPVNVSANGLYVCRPSQAVLFEKRGKTKKKPPEWDHPVPPTSIEFRP